MNRSLLVLLGGALTLGACSDDSSESDDASTSPSTSTSTATATTSGSGGTGGSGGAGGAGGTGGTTTSASSSSTSQGGSGGATTTGTTGGTGGEFVAPTLLSETGLYEADMTTLAEGVRPFEPAFKLWSDSADKQRWVKLPTLSQIDTSDMDYWVYPVGTKFFKEFTRDGVRVETRLLEKTGDGDWFMRAFQWNEEQTDAEARPDGVFDASGTEHDIPNENQCINCHEKMPDVALGFSAVQLSHDGDGVTLQELIDDDSLTDPPDAPFVIPGTETEQAALGYLHANCGNCHQPRSYVTNTVDMDLWLPTDELDDVDNTPTVLTTVGRQASQTFPGSDGAGGETSFDTRIVAGEPQNSIVYLRMISRETGKAMPPVGSELVDDEGTAVIEQWISSMVSP